MNVEIPDISGLFRYQRKAVQFDTVFCVVMIPVSVATLYAVVRHAARQGQLLFYFRLIAAVSIMLVTYLLECSNLLLE